MNSRIKLLNALGVTGGGKDCPELSAFANSLSGEQFRVLCGAAGKQLGEDNVAVRDALGAFDDVRGPKRPGKAPGENAAREEEATTKVVQISLPPFLGLIAAALGATLLLAGSRDSD